MATTHDADVFGLQARFCAILSNPTRLRIMALLEEQEMCVGDLARELSISLSTVSQHLQLMKDRRAVVQRRDGQNVYYRVTNPKFGKGSRLIREGLLEELRLPEEPRTPRKKQSSGRMARSRGGVRWTTKT
jgi:ArsR family transcriptional regulator